LFFDELVHAATCEQHPTLAEALAVLLDGLAAKPSDEVFGN
jgi:hypothetical protein